MRIRSCLMMVAALTASAQVASGFVVRGFVVANGGTSSIPASNGTYRAYGTAGQAGVQPGQNGGVRGCSGFWCFGGPRVLAVGPQVPGAPAEIELGPAVPNPTENEARFELALPSETVVTLSVYDVSGRRIGEPVSRRFEAGEHTFFWRAPGGRTGMYFLRLATDGVVRARRSIVLVR